MVEIQEAPPVQKAMVTDPTVVDLWEAYQQSLDLKKKKKQPATLNSELCKWRKDIKPETYTSVKEVRLFQAQSYPSKDLDWDPLLEALREFNQDQLNKADTLIKSVDNIDLSHD